MAYMSQEKKQQLAPGIKAVLAKHGVKATLGVRHHSTLVINLREGKLDIIGNLHETAQQSPDYDPLRWQTITSVQVNQYWLDQHYTGKVKEFLKELVAAANAGNHNRSDIQSDYFDVGWYLDINVGTWDKPYQVR